MDPLTLACFILVLVLQYLFHLSRRKTKVILIGTRTLLQIAGVDENRLKAIPIDPASILNNFNLDPVTVEYACCPKCYAVYPKDNAPPECTFHDPGGPICHTPLFRERKNRRNTPTAVQTPQPPEAPPAREANTPKVTYVHQDFKNWMARLLSRPGIEKLIDDHQGMLSRNGEISDIWDAPAFQNFKDASGQPFCRAMENHEGRYVFSLASDGFNPYQMKEAKQTVSSTGIYMALLNLPPHLRYLPENMYLAGVIPGPSKPSLDQINHFVDLVVKDFLPFWTPGVRFTRTFAHRHGRDARAVIIPLVCDSLAARQMAGFTPVTSTLFCTCCDLPLRDIENIDRTTWPRKDWETHRARAEQWKSATSAEERIRLAKENGVRWSPLLNLPYWNPVLFTVIDSMHNLYLGLIQNHCRVIWGIDVKNFGGDGLLRPIAYQRPPSALMARWLQKIKEAPNEAALQTLGEGATKPVLVYISLDNGLRTAGTKSQLAGRIISWVSVLLSSLKSFTKYYPHRDFVSTPHQSLYPK